MILCLVCITTLMSMSSLEHPECLHLHRVMECLVFLASVRSSLFPAPFLLSEGFLAYHWQACSWLYGIYRFVNLYAVPCSLRTIAWMTLHLVLSYSHPFSFQWFSMCQRSSFLFIFLYPRHSLLVSLYKAALDSVPLLNSPIHLHFWLPRLSL